MASICDSCFESDTGILPEADFPYDASFADRLYCVDGYPTAPPSNGAVQSLWAEVSAQPVGALTSGTAITLEWGGLTWTNLTGRTATVVVLADASVLSDSGSTSFASYVEMAYAFSLSDASTLATMKLQLPALPTTLGTVTPATGSCSSFSKAVPPGVTISVTPTAAFYSTSGASGSILALSSSVALMGAL